MDALQLTRELVAFESPSHTSNRDVSHFLAERLESLGFTIELDTYESDTGVEKVNVLAHKPATASSQTSAASASSNRGLAYFCHSDVVPAESWTGPGGAFSPTEYGGKLYGRGSCDMKGSVASMVSAISRLSDTPLTAPLYFVCTADEEISYLGAHHLVANSPLYREMVAQQPRAIIGEPTELDVVYAHKGICELYVVSEGESAHSSTRDGLNANLAMIPFLHELKQIYDETESNKSWTNDEFDPPTMSLNIGINDHTRALNVKPARSTCTIFYRPLPGVDDQPLMDRIRQAAGRQGLQFEVHARCGAVYTPADSDFVTEAVTVAGHERPLTVSYGTDAGALTELNDKIVCGPGSIMQAHTSSEFIELDQLVRGTDLFEKFLRRWCT